MKRHFFPLLGFLFLCFFICKTSWQVNANTQKQFSSYLDQLFIDWVSSDTITLHYQLTDASKYRIKKETISLSNSFLKNTSDYDKELDALHSFPKDSLTSSQKKIYHILDDYLTRQKKLSAYPLYQTIFSPTTGIQAQLPVTLCEFPIDTEHDIIVYLSLLKKIPDYFQNLYEIEQQKTKEGLFCSNRTLEQILNQMDSFLSEPTKNPLILSFSEQIQSVPLTKQQKQSYIDQNKNLILYTVLPAYQTLRNHLASLKDSGKNDLGLCYYKKGKAYYSALAAALTGSDATPPEMIQMTEDNIKSCYKELQEILYLYPDAYQQFLNTKLSDYIPSAESDILDYLKNSLPAAFPSIHAVSSTIKEVPDCLQDYVSPAFYMIPPIDNAATNTIYINKSEISSANDSYGILAHEGYPGHLYQTNYFYQHMEHPVLSLCNYEGYTEGWAVYAENLSYSFLDFKQYSDTIAKLYQINQILNLAISARIDLGVHYEGWNQKNVNHFLSGLGLEKEEISSEIFDIVIAEPGNYLSYYIGYLEISSLRKDYLNFIDIYNKKDHFYEFLLRNGPCDFSYLNDMVNTNS
jgi:uncharacterized protein (DUF885 family)